MTIVIEDDNLLVNCRDDGGIFHNALKSLLVRLYKAIASISDEIIIIEIPTPVTMLLRLDEKDREQVVGDSLGVGVVDEFGSEQWGIVMCSSPQLAQELQSRHQLSAKPLTSKPNVLLSGFFTIERQEEGDGMLIVIDPTGDSPVEFLQAVSLDAYLTALLTWVNADLPEAPMLQTITVPVLWGKDFFESE